MSLILQLLVGLIAIEHLGFLFLEMFLWSKPLGLRIFGHSLSKAQTTQLLAANQGLYNGFLAAGLTWSLCASPESHALKLQVFFLSCVAIAGAYGGFSVKKSIFFIQAMPALVSLLTLGLVYSFSGR